METKKIDYVLGAFHNISKIKYLNPIFWNKKLYYVYKNQLVACKVIKMKYNFLENSTHIILKMAKYGEVSISLISDQKFYLSIDDFHNNVSLTTSSTTYVTYIRPLDAIVNAFGEIKIGEVYKCYNEYLRLIQYKWDGVQAIRVDGKVPKIMYYDIKKGFYFDDEVYSLDMYKDLYPTKADCELCNEISVVDFDDDDKDDEDNTNYNLVIFGVLNSKISKNELEKIKEILK